MTVKSTYPGVYVEEFTGRGQAIAGITTATTVFVGWAGRGPVHAAQRVRGFMDFERSYGGFDGRSLLGYAVRHFFENGGSEAYIVRVVAENAAPASAMLDGTLRVEAQSPGAWANDYAVEIRAQADDPGRFGLTLWHQPPGGAAAVVEHFDDLSMDAHDVRVVDTQINTRSALVKVVRIGNPAAQPADTPANAPLRLAGGRDGDILAANSAAFARHFPPDCTGGIFSLLEALESFNLLVVPGEANPTVIATLQTYCRKRRAFCILDSAENATLEEMRAPLDAAIVGPDAMNSALYFPWVSAADPLQAGQTRSFPASGFVAGICARTDHDRGVWKAPAGVDADVRGAATVSVPLNDLQAGELNDHGINCIRAFPLGIVVWGSRTLHGDDQLGSQWKYVPVRRMALYLEDSIDRGTQWTVFEPNGDALWAQIRLSVGAFMHAVFAQGAFQGHTPRETYFVKCDNETTTQNDIDLGRVNIVVGFAPLKPAEFVTIQIQKISRAIQT